MKYDFEQIKEIVLKNCTSIKAAFIIGSYAYSDIYSDIDIIVFTNDKTFSYRILENNIKINIFPYKAFKKDLKTEKYGSFIYGRLLNPYLCLFNEKQINTMQNLAIIREKFSQKNIKSHNDVIRNFVLNRGMIFNKYFKTINLINNKNEHVKNFFTKIMKLNFKLKHYLYFSKRNIKVINRYWTFRFELKNKGIDFYEIIYSNKRETIENEIHKKFS